MGQTPEELRGEIESARADLGRTLDAIGERVNPRRVAQRRMHAARSGMTQVRERVMGSAEDVMQDTGDRAQELSASGREALESAGGAVGDAGQAVAERAQEVPAMVAQRTQGNPLAAGLIAFGLGALAASLVPETEAERRQAHRLRRSVVQPLQEQVGQAGQEVVADLRDSARASKDTITEQARAAVDEVRGEAQQGAGQLREQGVGAAQSVRGDAQAAARSVRDGG